MINPPHDALSTLEWLLAERIDVITVEQNRLATEKAMRARALTMLRTGAKIQEVIGWLASQNIEVPHRGLLERWLHEETLAKNGGDR